MVHLNNCATTVSSKKSCTQKCSLRCKHLLNNTKDNSLWTAPPPPPPPPKNAGNAPLIIVCRLLDTPNCLQRHIKNAKTARFFYSEPSALPKEALCNVLPLYDFWFTFYDKFCSPYTIVDFLRIFRPRLHGYVFI